MPRNIAEIEGIGPALSEKFANAGIKTVENLLEKGATPSGRSEISNMAGVDETRILKWVNMADLFRIKGVGSEYAELLEAAGVDTIKELRNRNAENLHTKILEINDEKNLVRKTPTLEQVKSFVEHAGKLDPFVTY
jgi:predicted flap endonuclease-1-like 5' DNA nuclease